MSQPHHKNLESRIAPCGLLQFRVTRARAPWHKRLLRRFLPFLGR